MGRGLSDLQKRIISVIAKHTINIYADDAGWGHGRHDIPYSELRHEVVAEHYTGKGQHAPADQWRKGWASEKAAFSRALHALVEKHRLVGALALAWCQVDSCEWVGWQGRHRRKVERHGARGFMGHNIPASTTKTETPTYRLLHLTEAGWATAKTLC